MKMMTGTLQAVVVATALALGANAAQATPAADHGTDGTTHEVRVANNSMGPVRVYVQDAAGRLHWLSKVARGETKVMEVASDIASAGAFRIQVVRDAPVWAPWDSGEGITTHDLNLPMGSAIHLWLALDLRDSTIEIPKL